MLSSGMKNHSSFLIPQYKKPTHFFVHISDTHLISGNDNLYGSDVNGDQTLKELLYELEMSQARPDAIIVTGDIADVGEPDAYRKALNIIEPVAKRMNTEVIWVMGNHDNRAHFREILLDENPSLKEVDKVYNFNGLRLISLDTSVVGHHYGEVTDEQIEWLEEVLKTPAELGTIIAMHHPPIPSVLDLASAVELKEQKKLVSVLQGSDVKSIIAGHLHYSSNATFAGIPVSVATSTCYTQDLNVEVGGTRGRAGAQGFNLVHVYEETILHSVVPIGEFSTVGKFVSARETQEILNKIYSLA